MYTDRQNTIEIISIQPIDYHRYTTQNISCSVSIDQLEAEISKKITICGVTFFLSQFTVRHYILLFLLLLLLLLLHYYLKSISRVFHPLITVMQCTSMMKLLHLMIRKLDSSTIISTQSVHLNLSYLLLIYYPIPMIIHASALSISLKKTSSKPYLDPSKAKGIENFGPLLLKRCSLALSALLHHLFNSSIQSDSIPSQWRTHLITPVFKSEDRSSVCNYHPISFSTSNHFKGPWMINLWRNNIPCHSPVVQFSIWLSSW